MRKLTRKNSCVEECRSAPYSTSVCFDRSSAELIGVTMRSTVKKAAKFAVYEDMMIRVKNHQTPPTIRPDIDLNIYGWQRIFSRESRKEQFNYCTKQVPVKNPKKEEREEKMTRRPSFGDFEEGEKIFEENFWRKNHPKRESLRDENRKRKIPFRGRQQHASCSLLGHYDDRPGLCPRYN